MGVEVSQASFGNFIDIVAMATEATTGEPRRELVWVRGPGLNAPGAENRAREIAGEGWRNAVIRGTVMHVMRNGRKHVKLALGPSLWIEPRYLTTEPNEAEPHSEYVSVREEGEHELGSDAEEEDLPGEDGEVEGAQSVRVIRGDRDWTIIISIIIIILSERISQNISQNSRKKEGRKEEKCLTPDPVQGNRRVERATTHNKQRGLF